MSYYKTIDGVRYDRQLLERAQALTDGRGDGRISLADIQLLYEEVQDRGLITETEERTLAYIRDHFQLTAKALHWLREQIDDDANNLDIVIEQIFTELGVEKLGWDMLEEDIEEQEELDDSLTFEEALYAALNSFIRDGETAESPQDVVLATHKDLREENFDNPSEFHRALRDKVRAYMQDEGLITLLPLNIYDMDEEELGDLQPPEGQESLNESWIFSLRLPKLSDHVYWAVVDRAGMLETFNYGFN